MMNRPDERIHIYAVVEKDGKEYRPYIGKFVSFTDAEFAVKGLLNHYAKLCLKDANDACYYYE